MAQVAVTLGNSRDGGVFKTVQDVDADQVNKILFVPAGKVWKVLSATGVVTPSADAGNRQIQLECQEADAYGVLFTVNALNVQVASSVERYVFSPGFGEPTEAVATFHNVGIPNETFLGPAQSLRFTDTAAIQDGTQSQGTLTIAEPVTAGDTFTIGAKTFTLVAALTAQDQVLIGANEAATKVNIDAALGATPSGAYTLHTVTPTARAETEVVGTDFSGDAFVLTANLAGTLGDAVVTTETFTHVSNVFDAATLGTTTPGVAASDATNLQVQVVEYDA